MSLPYIKKTLFLWLVFIVLLFTLPNIAFGVQTVYLAKNPVFLKHIATLKKRGKNTEEVVKILLDHDFLQEITPELARREFGINWLESSFDMPLPRLIVGNMGREVGYGLFTIDIVPMPAIPIVQYTGTVITNPNTFQNNPYVIEASEKESFFRKVDALREGNAGRFAQHLPNEDELAQYIFNNPLQRQQIATANSVIDLSTYVPTKPSFLVSTRRIESFEQVGHFYDKHYGFPHSIWSSQPCLFDKTGNIVPPQEYCYPKVIAIVNSGDLGKYPIRSSTLCINDMRISRKIHSLIHKDGYVYFENNDDTRFMVNYDELMSQLQQQRSRVSVNGLIIHKDEVLEYVEKHLAATSTKLSSGGGDSSSSSANSLGNQVGAANSINQGSAQSVETTVVDSGSDSVMELRKQLFDILNFIYSSDMCSYKHSGEIKERTGKLSMEISNSLELSPEQKGELKSIIDRIENLLSYEFAVKNEDFNEVFTNGNDLQDFSNIDISPPKEFIIKKFLPPPLPFVLSSI